MLEFNKISYDDTTHRDNKIINKTSYDDTTHREEVRNTDTITLLYLNTELLPFVIFFKVGLLNNPLPFLSGRSLGVLITFSDSSSYIYFHLQRFFHSYLPRGFQSRLLQNCCMWERVSALLWTKKHVLKIRLRQCDSYYNQAPTRKLFCHMTAIG